ncbi:helix-turn-helix domain-containing protein [Jiella marina]|uniref:helix-turn-helix domain-containing protein n=1 Tax=Jiella sp. LLJ827 TaxID=2917712 RepID=UPI0021011A2A|nr:helix-turn-helix domain-containing protein [Jiella sp. LLJ827]MCQ0989682.1 helix-turn-helix domain-containing protein [Jiella sp. LLJ827]
MLALPISIVVSLALAYTLVRLVVRGAITAPLAALLVTCMVQGVINALAQYYAVAPFRLVQPVTAALIPPLAWLALKAARDSGRLEGTALLHLLAPAFVGFCIWRVREVIDPAVIAIFAGYGVAMLHVLRRGADALPEARLDAGDWPPLIWRVIAIAMVFSALSDAAISVAVLSGDGWVKSWIVSVGSSLTLLLIGVCASSRNLGNAETTPETGLGDQPNQDEGEIAAERERDRAIMAELDHLLRDQGLSRDSELTLSRLARRLGLPAKRVSEAINRQTGGNVSRHVNAYRVADACNELAAGASVTGAMLASGFATKSNFNREFRRLTAMAPTEWLAMRHATKSAPKPLLPDWRGAETTSPPLA